MAIFKPFQAIRPTPELVEKVAALPYDVMNSDEAREMTHGNLYSFLHIDKAEIDMDPAQDPYSQAVYEKARDNLQQMIHEGILLQDAQRNFYIYQLVMKGRVQTGLVGCTSIDDYLADVIKKHEHTRADKELDRINHVDYCNANTGPIFLTYRSKEEMNERIAKWMETHEPVYHFVSEDDIGHTVWVIDDFNFIQGIEAFFQGIESLYIADGHHRSASAVKVGIRRRQENPGYVGTEEFNYFLSVLFPDEQLQIMDYNRVVKDLNGNTTEEFMDKIRDNFEIVAVEGEGLYKPVVKHTFGMYLDGRWYKLTAKDRSYNPVDPVGRLDVTIIQNNLLQPILGIQDPRTDKRIDFVGGIRGLNELERRVQEGMKVAFAMYPTTVGDLMAIADAGEVMPPKSTWFEPKLRSGLFIHTLK